MSTQATSIEATAEGPVYIAKMSMKSVGAKPAVAVADTTDPVAIVRILGKATSVGSGEDTRDGRVFQFLKGSFAAMNLKTGEEFRSGKLFLPTGIAEPIEEAAKNVPEGSELAFALDIYAVKASNAIGYSYRAKSLVTQKQDSLDDLRKALTIKAAPAIEAVPAPKAVPAIEAPKADSKKK